MSAMSLAILDKRVMNHLSRGGSVYDDVGRQLVGKFVNEALKTPSIREAMHRYDFDANDLCVIYAESIDSLMPNPCIETGGPMLAGSLAFIEPFRIEAFLGQARHRIEDGMTPKERQDVLKQCAGEATAVTWHMHTQMRGEAAFYRDPSGTGSKSAGCFGLLIACALIGSIVTTAALIC
jgi:hypothetical protein